MSTLEVVEHGWRKPEMNGYHSYDHVSLADVLEKYDLLEVTEEAIIVAERPKAFADLGSGAVDMREYGSSGNTAYGALLRMEYNPQLRWLEGVRTFDKMRKSDAQVKSILRIMKTPLQAARWYMQPVSQGKKDKKIADFIWNNLTKEMSQSWPQFLTEALSFIDFGNYSFEKVFTQRPDGMIAWQKFATRHPYDLYRWEYDEKGGVNGGLFYTDEQKSASAVFIPIEKLLVFILDREADAMEGVSVLRACYKHWYYKENLYKVDAIQKERHGIGIPIIKLPPNYSPADKQLADQMGRNLRTNEKAHIVLPPMWDILFADLKGQPVDCLKSIEHHDDEMMRAVLAFFTDPDAKGHHEDIESLFLKSTRYIGEIVRDCINKWAIPELVKYNWGENVEPPELRVRRLGDTTDWRQISFAIRNFIGAGVIIPDKPLEDWVRTEMDLPDADPSTARDIGTPQASGTPMEISPEQAAKGVIPSPQPPQLPQQSQAGNMQIGTGKSNTGADTTGK